MSWKKPLLRDPTLTWAISSASLQIRCQCLIAQTQRWLLRPTSSERSCSMEGHSVYRSSCRVKRALPTWVRARITSLIFCICMRLQVMIISVRGSSTCCVDWMRAVGAMFWKYLAMPPSCTIIVVLSLLTLYSDPHRRMCIIHSSQQSSMSGFSSHYCYCYDFLYYCVLYHY